MPVVLIDTEQIAQIKLGRIPGKAPSPSPCFGIILANAVQPRIDTDGHGLWAKLFNRRDAMNAEIGLRMFSFSALQSSNLLSNCEDFPEGG